MRISVVITKSVAPNDGWSVVIESQGGPKAVRELRAGQNGMPLPPLAEKTFWEALSCGQHCVGPDDRALINLQKDIVSGNIRDDVIGKFGNYLFAILLGPAWREIERTAPAGETIEVEILLAVTDRMMQRLQWEMMLDGDEPLGAHQGRTVAVARVIASPPQAATEIVLPLRVLFVIGKQIDQTLRPGAEYVGLIRHLSATKADQNVPQSIDIHLRLLPEATADELTAAVREFDPAVVHFIAHGRWDANNEPQIILTQKTGPAEAPVITEDACSPERLIGLMRKADGRPPPVIVLNACHTADAKPNDAYLPYAAELVNRGALIALGMAGEVADAACRIFTRAFYRSLLDLQSVTVAAAQGRRAAMLQYKNYSQNVEWARPTLFVRQHAPPVIKIDRPNQIVAAVAFRFRPRTEPAMLCDRFDALDAYQKYRSTVRAEDYRSALAFEVPDDANTVQVQPGLAFQVGKTRLLGELASIAVLDGYLPCLLYSSDGFQAPPNILKFAIRLADVMDDVRDQFRDSTGALLLPRRKDSVALRLAAGVCKLDYRCDLSTPQKVTEFNVAKQTIVTATERLGPFDKDPPIDTDSIVDAIRADAERLLADVQAQVHPDRVDGEPPRFHSLLLLIDDLHNYEGVALPLLQTILKSGIAGPAGRVATIFTYGTRVKIGPDVMNFIKDKQQIQRHSLQPFRQPDESRLAYALMMLSRAKPLAPNGSAENKERVDALFKTMHGQIQGVPSYFGRAEGVIDFCMQTKVLVEADDEEIMRAR